MHALCICQVWKCGNKRMVKFSHSWQYFNFDAEKKWNTRRKLDSTFIHCIIWIYATRNIRNFSFNKQIINGIIWWKILMTLNIFKQFFPCETQKNIEVEKFIILIEIESVSNWVCNICCAQVKTIPRRHFEPLKMSILRKNRLHIWSISLPFGHNHIRTNCVLCLRSFQLLFYSFSANERFVSIIFISVNPLQVIVIQSSSHSKSNLRFLYFRTHIYVDETWVSYANGR